MSVLDDQIEDITSKDGLADFVAALRSDLVARPHEWENATLDGFLEAMEAWVRSMDNFYRNAGRAAPKPGDWRLFADILYAAKSYE